MGTSVGWLHLVSKIIRDLNIVLLRIYCPQTEGPVLCRDDSSWVTDPGKIQSAWEDFAIACYFAMSSNASTESDHSPFSPQK
jgi:hypothetical protein